MPFLYIDATAGGLLVQILLGGAAGIAVVGRLALGRIPGLRRRRSRRSEDGTPVDGHDPAADA